MMRSEGGEDVRKSLIGHRRMLLSSPQFCNRGACNQGDYLEADQYPLTRRARLVM